MTDNQEIVGGEKKQSQKWKKAFNFICTQRKGKKHSQSHRLSIKRRIENVLQSVGNEQFKINTSRIHSNYIFN